MLERRLGVRNEDQRSKIIEDIVNPTVEQRLIQLAGKNCSEEVSRILQARVNANTQNRFGQTSLMVASFKGHIKKVRLLLQNDVASKYSQIERVQGMDGFLLIDLDDWYTKPLDLQRLPSVFTTQFCMLCF